MNSKLPEFLAREAARPWIWGEHDCGLWRADWLVFATGCEDPAAHLRRTYTSAQSLEARYGAAALLKLSRAVFAALPRTGDALAGDIGVIAVKTGSTRRDRIAIGAIRGRHGWIVPAPLPAATGLTCLADEQCRTIAAWRVEEKSCRN